MSLTLGWRSVIQALSGCRGTSGSIYLSEMALRSAGSGLVLTMSFEGQPQTRVAKLLSTLMGFMIKRAMVDAVRKDLADIKRFVDNHGYFIF